jgi:adenylosuccinate lyase
VSLSSQPLSPLDGRYAASVTSLSLLLSEAGLNRARIQVEIEWIIWLSSRNLLSQGEPLTENQRTALRNVVTNFSDADVAKLFETESQTKHDVKAVEYFVRDKLTEIGRGDLHELTHFACTSEDINNLSYAIIIRDAVQSIWLPKAKDLVASLKELAVRYAATPMLSRTHGQPATPTTIGK